MGLLRTEKLSQLHKDVSDGEATLRSHRIFGVSTAVATFFHTNSLGSCTRARTPTLEVSLSSSLPPTGGCCPPQRNTHRNTTENFPPHHPAYIVDSSTTIACNMSDTYSEVKRRIQQAVDEMRALKSTPVITDFARKHDVRLRARFNRIRPCSGESPIFRH
jgi:hypothetical protein